MAAQRIESVGGYPEDTLAEDQDLTIAIQRKKWKVAYDEEAVAWTEAPETFGALSKQRFRWSYGTLQCLWKHRKIMRRASRGPRLHRRAAGLGVPDPVCGDFARHRSCAGRLDHGHDHPRDPARLGADADRRLRMAVYWAAFSSIDLVCGWIAYRMDVRDKKFRPFLLLSQRLSIAS
jgi:hypothetical protein